MGATATDRDGGAALSFIQCDTRCDPQPLPIPPAYRRRRLLMPAHVVTPFAVTGVAAHPVAAGSPARIRVGSEHREYKDRHDKGRADTRGVCHVTSPPEVRHYPSKKARPALHQSLALEVVLRKLLNDRGGKRVHAG
jgi:hypothetical protein